MQTNSNNKPGPNGWLHFDNMIALVTRPEPQASAWAQSLRDAGVDAAPLPLIAITGPANPQAVSDLWLNLSQYRALMFVSPAAVDWFFHLRPADATWPSETLAAAPGPGTGRQLLSAGQTCGLGPSQLVSPGPDAAQFDSETLWPLLSGMNWQHQHVCIISGGDSQEAKGRTWLTQQWQSQGAQVHTLLTYQRGPAHWDTAQQAVAQQALSQPHAHTWLFSSSEALGFLKDQLTAAQPDRAPLVWAELRALVTHPRIADTCRQFGIRHITQTRPDLSEVVSALRQAPATAGGSIQ